MPYKDPERRRQAERKSRRAHREQRAAYMRRYRKARSSGRRPGRPRSANADGPRVSPSAERAADLDLNSYEVLASGTERFPQESPPANEHPAEAPPTEPARDREVLPPSPSAAVSWEAALQFPGF